MKPYTTLFRSGPAVFSLVLVLTLLGAFSMFRVQGQLPPYTLLPPTDLQAGPVECFVYLSWEKPMIAVDGNGRAYSPVLDDSIWDLLFSWFATESHRPGIEEDLNYIYLSASQSGFGAPPWFQRYEKVTGILIDTFSIQGATGIVDLTSDGQYFYGSPVSSVIYKMDFVNHILIDSISTPLVTGIRHIAYDPNIQNGVGGFWCGNWNDLHAISWSGNVLFSYPLADDCSGSTWEDFSSPGFYLWTFTQNVTGQPLLTQYAIGYNPLSLTPTGVVFNVATVPGYVAGSAPGGLCSGPVGSLNALFADLQQDPQFIVAFNQVSYGPQYVPPPGLTGYRIYRDGAYLASVSGQDTVWFYDGDVLPGQHAYQVSAVYDLMEYDYPGFTDESVTTVPDSVTIICSGTLPFCEDWVQASFAYHNWKFSPDQGNWVISIEEGQPVPAVAFTGLPGAVDYSESLWLSLYQALGFTCAEFTCGFDLKLDNVLATGNEKLEIGLFYLGYWHTLDVLENTASFDWTHFSYTIPYTGGDEVRIRFRAFGESSVDLGAWYLDNICFLAEGYPPLYLSGQYTGETVELTWSPPDCRKPDPVSFLTEEISYHTSIPGLSTVGYFDHIYGTVFALSQLPQETLLHQIDFHHDAWGGPCNWKFRIHVVDWDQLQVLSTIGPFFTDEDGGWAGTISLDSITGLGGGHAGIFVQPMGNVPDNAYPRVSGDNATIPGSSFYGTFPGFGNLDSLPSGNYLINLTVLVPDTTEDIHINGSFPSGDDPDLLTYVVYRSDNSQGGFCPITPQPIPDTTYPDDDLPAGPETFYYYVQACHNYSFWSASSDTVSVVVTNISDPEPSLASLTPNPASQMVTITAGRPITRVSFTNTVGQIVFDGECDGRSSCELNVSLLPAGIYQVLVTMDDRKTVVRLSVVR